MTPSQLFVCWDEQAGGQHVHGTRRGVLQRQRQCRRLSQGVSQLPLPPICVHARAGVEDAADGVAPGRVIAPAAYLRPSRVGQGLYLCAYQQRHSLSHLPVLPHVVPVPNTHHLPRVGVVWCVGCDVLGMRCR